MIFQAQEPVKRTVEERIERGKRAQELLADPVLIESVETAERSNLRDMILGDTAEIRETARARILAMDQVIESLTAIATDGQVAAEAVRRRKT